MRALLAELGSPETRLPLLLAQEELLGRTALHFAAERGQEAVVRALLADLAPENGGLDLQWRTGTVVMKQDEVGAGALFQLDRLEAKQPRGVEPGHCH